MAPDTLAPLHDGLFNVTPEVAARWLENKRRNRTLNKSNLQRLIEEIREGRWRGDTNGTTMGFDAEGRLADGVHRCSAIIASECAGPFPIWVVTGMTDEDIDSIDTGATRTVGDKLNMKNFANGTALAGAARWLLKYERGNLGGTMMAPSFAETERIVIKYMPGLARSAHVGKTMGLRRTSASLWGAMHCLLTIAGGPDIADEFFHAVRTGEGLHSGDPALALRNRMIQNITAKHAISGEDQAAMIVRAWNARIEGRPLVLPKGMIAGERFPHISGMPQRR